MRKISVMLLLCIFLNTVVYGGEELSKNDISAMGAVLIDAETGRVLWGKNEHTPLAMASTTKIMTALLTIEKADLNDIVKVSKRAAATPAVKMYLNAEEEIKLEHLLYALMLQSSNDAAVAIAEHVGGSVEEFCNMMTEKAKEIGAEDTIFETPNGLDAGDHHSTAYDMGLIASYALKNKEFMRIINTPSISFSSSRKSYDVINKNRLLNEYEGANGMKTGFTGKAGQCFVGSAKRDDLQLVSVVLASGWGNVGKEQKWKDTKKILNYGFQNYTYQNIIEKGDKAGIIEIERSKTEKVDTIFSEGFFLAVNKEEYDNIVVDIIQPELIRAPIEEGQQLGVAKIYINGDLQKEISLIATDFAERHDFKTSLEKVGSNWLMQGTNGEVEVVLPEF